MVRSSGAQFLMVGSLALILGLGSLLAHSSAAGEGTPAGPGLAEEGSASNLKLIKTWIKTRDDTVVLGTTPVDIFTPTTVTCPGSAPSCTLRIEVSSTLFLANQNPMYFTVVVARSTVKPSSLVTVADHYDISATMSWMVQGITAGTSPIVSVRASTLLESGLREVHLRTLTIGVYKP